MPDPADDPRWQRERPGLVVTCFNLHKPRDRSHYEFFPAYHESFRLHLGLSRIELAQRESGTERLVPFRDIQAELSRQGLAGVEQVGSEAEDLRQELGKVPNRPLLALALRVQDRAQVEQPLLDGRRLPSHALGIDEDGNGDDQALGGLDQAKPFLVEEDFGIGHGGGDFSVPGLKD